MLLYSPTKDTDIKMAYMAYMAHMLPIWLFNV